MLIDQHAIKPELIEEKREEIRLNNARQSNLKREQVVLPSFQETLDMIKNQISSSNSISNSSIIDRSTPQGSSLMNANSLFSPIPSNDSSKPIYSRSTTTDFPSMLNEFPNGFSGLGLQGLEFTSNFNNLLTNKTESERVTLLELDNEGSLHYNALGNCSSVLLETKKIFNAILGKAKFDTLQSTNPVDKPIDVEAIPLAEIPDGNTCFKLYKVYTKTISWQFYMFDEGEFSQTTENVINGSKNIKEKILVYLVLGVAQRMDDYEKGVQGSDKSVDYIKSALHLRNFLTDNDDLWLIQYYYLQSIYYLVTHKFQTSWFFLTHAIEHAQRLNIHKKPRKGSKKVDPKHHIKLFRSLYFSDCIFSMAVGKSMLFNDEECDGFNPYEKSLEISKFKKTFPIKNGKPNYVANPDKDDNFRMKWDFYKFQVIHILGKILKTCYHNSKIDLDNIKKLAIELKEWFVNLPPDLLVENTSTDTSEDEVKHRYACIYINSFHIHAISVLSRPFLIYEKACQINDLKEEYQNLISKELIHEYKQASIKSSALMIIAIICSESNQSYRTFLTNFKVNCALNSCLTLITCLIDDLNSQLLNLIKYGLLLLKTSTDVLPPARFFVSILEEMVNEISDHHLNIQNENFFQDLEILDLPSLQGDIFPEVDHIRWIETQNDFVPNQIASLPTNYQ